MENAAYGKEPPATSHLSPDRNQLVQPAPPLRITPPPLGTEPPAAVGPASALEALPVDVLREICTYIPLRPRLRVLSLVSRRLRHVVIRSAERIPPGAPAIAYKVLQYVTTVANTFVLPMPPARLPSTVRTVWIKPAPPKNSSESIYDGLSHLTSLSQFQLASASLLPHFCTLIERNVATLEYITLRHQQQKETDEWQKFVSFRLPCLKRLYLQLPTISADTLAFLSAHVAHITYLTLHATTPNVEPSFEHAIATLCNMQLPKLTNIVLFYLGPAAAAHISRLVANAPLLTEVTIMLTLDATTAATLRILAPFALNLWLSRTPAEEAHRNATLAALQTCTKTQRLGFRDMPPHTRVQYIQTVAPHLLFMNPHPGPSLLAELPHLQKLELKEHLASTFEWPPLTNLTHLNLTLANFPIATAFVKLREALHAMPCLSVLRVELGAIETSDFYLWESFLGEAQRRNLQEITYIARQKDCLKIKLQWYAWRAKFEWLRLRFEEAAP